MAGRRLVAAILGLRRRVSFFEAFGWRVPTLDALAAVAGSCLVVAHVLLPSFGFGGGLVGAGALGGGWCPPSFFLGGLSGGFIGHWIV